MKRQMTKLMSAVAVAGVVCSAGVASAATQVKITVTNNAPTGGIYLTPLWVGFHDGSFDSYDVGLAAQPGVVDIATAGDPTQISGDFLNGKTYIDGGVSDTVDSSQAGSERVDASTTGGSIAPGASAMTGVLVIDAAGVNKYFSYGAMILPSNDYFIGNGDPMAVDVSSLNGAANGTTITFNVLMGYDAGARVNDFETSLGNPLAGLTASVSPNNVAQNGLVALVNAPYGDFLNSPGGLSDLIFTNGGLYTSGIATISIEVVPEPASMMLLGLSSMGLLVRRRR